MYSEFGGLEVYCITFLLVRDSLILIYNRGKIGVGEPGEGEERAGKKLTP